MKDPVRQVIKIATNALLLNKFFAKNVENLSNLTVLCVER